VLFVPLMLGSPVEGGTIGAVYGQSDTVMNAAVQMATVKGYPVQRWGAS
jgi:hypothetical protein